MATTAPTKHDATSAAAGAALSPALSYLPSLPTTSLHHLTHPLPCLLALALQLQEPVSGRASGWLLCLVSIRCGWVLCLAVVPGWCCVWHLCLGGVVSGGCAWVGIASGGCVWLLCRESVVQGMKGAAGLVCGAAWCVQSPMPARAQHELEWVPRANDYFAVLWWGLCCAAGAPVRPALYVVLRWARWRLGCCLPCTDCSVCDMRSWAVGAWRAVSVPG